MPRRRCWPRRWETPSSCRCSSPSRCCSWLLALKLTGHWSHIPEGTIIYSHFFPTLLVDLIFVPAFFFAVAVLGKGVMAFWQDINAPHPWRVKVEGNLVGNLIATLKDIILHNRFRSCETTYNRSTNHLFLVFGFIFLAIVTTWGFLKEWVLHHRIPVLSVCHR